VAIERFRPIYPDIVKQMVNYALRLLLDPDTPDLTFFGSLEFINRLNPAFKKEAIIKFLPHLKGSLDKDKCRWEPRCGGKLEVGGSAPEVVLGDRGLHEEERASREDRGLDCIYLAVLQYLKHFVLKQLRVNSLLLQG